MLLLLLRLQGNDTRRSCLQPWEVIIYNWSPSGTATHSASSFVQCRAPSSSQASSRGGLGSGHGLAQLAVLIAQVGNLYLELLDVIDCVVKQGGLAGPRDRKRQRLSKSVEAFVQILPPLTLHRTLLGLALHRFDATGG